MSPDKREAGGRDNRRTTQPTESTTTEGANSPRITDPAPGLGAYDPFDPAALRVDAVAEYDVEQVLTTVPVRKPKRTEWFRVHPSPDYSLDMSLLERENGMDREPYLVTPEIRPLVATELKFVRLFTVMNRRGSVFLWTVSLPGDGDNRIRRISDSALQGADQAKTLWTKLAWDRDLGAYQMFRAKGDLGDPQWPDKSLRDLIAIAFRYNLIDRDDHEIIRELAGEI
ncbi:hypothetical protein [Mycobacterium sp.]|uniref:hypothetical protein n=1 Tax=Mycobacterium sp. TaxID=1785 RepID=UPI003BB13D7D